MIDEIPNRLRNYIDKAVTLNSTEWQQLQAAFSVQNVAAKTALTSIGQIASKLYYIDTGLMRLFYTRPTGEQITSFIFTEAMFASCHESLLQQIPSIQTLETIEPCRLLTISRDALAQLYQDVPKVHIVTRVVVEERFINAQRLFSSYLLEFLKSKFLCSRM